MSVSISASYRLAFPYKGYNSKLDTKVVDIMKSLFESANGSVLDNVFCLQVNNGRHLKFRDFTFDYGQEPIVDEIELKNIDDRNMWASTTIQKMLCEDMSMKWSNVKCKTIQEFCKDFNCIIEEDSYCLDSQNGYRTIYGTDGTEWLNKSFHDDDMIEVDELNLRRDDCYRKTFDEVVVENYFTDLIISFDLQDFNKSFKA